VVVPPAPPPAPVPDAAALAALLQLLALQSAGAGATAAGPALAPSPPPPPARSLLTTAFTAPLVDPLPVPAATSDGAALGASAWLRRLGSNGLPFYVHVSSGTSSWAPPPPGASLFEAGADGALLPVALPAPAPAQQPSQEFGPDTWLQKMSSKGVPYYVNLASREVAWQAPSAARIFTLGADGGLAQVHGGGGGGGGGVGGPVGAPPPEWRRKFSKTQGAYYLVNVHTGEAKWAEEDAADK
jgi:hypothetical protein